MKFLLVDDEPIVLSSVARALRPTGWEVIKAASGAAALRVLAAAPIDVILSDVQMPGMDGAALLARVQLGWPDTLRVAWSGYADDQTVARLVTVAHRMVDKPLPVAELVDLVTGMTRARARVPAGSLRAEVGAARPLPCAPLVVAEVRAAADDPAPTTATLRATARRDPAVTAALLRLAGSSFFSRACSTASLTTAIEQIGTMASRTALDATLTPPPPATAHLIDEVHTRAVAAAALVSRLTGGGNPDAFAATLLADLGTVVLATWRPDQLLGTIAIAAASGRPLEQVEREQLGAGHPEIGGQLLGAWGLPSTVVDAVAHHHEPAHAPRTAWHALIPAHVAHALVADGPLDADFLAQAGVGPADLARWHTLLDEGRRRRAGQRPPPIPTKTPNVP